MAILSGNEGKPLSLLKVVDDSFLYILRGRKPHRRDIMGFREDVAAKLTEEAIETAVKDGMSSAMRTAADGGLDPKGIVVQALLAPFKPDSLPMRLLAPMPGFVRRQAVVALATTLGSLIQRYALQLLPSDPRPGVVQAKMILSLLPHITVGAVEGIMDIQRAIESQVDSVRSDLSAAATGQPKWLDSVIKSKELPGRFFALADLPNPDGSFRSSPTDGVPYCNHPEWLRAKAAWDRTHAATSRIEYSGGGKGGKGGRQTVIHEKADPFPWEVVPMEDMIAEVQAGTASMSQSDIDMLKKRNAKAPDWWETAGPEVRRLLMVYSFSARKGGFTLFTEGEDLAKDVVGKSTGLTLLRDLAAEHLPHVRNGVLSVNRVQAISDAFDVLLGAELTFFHKAERAARRVLGNWHGVSASTKSLGVFAIIMAAALPLTLAIMTGVCLFNLWQGMFMPLNVSQSGVDPQTHVIALVTVNALYLIVMFLLLKPVQGIIDAIFSPKKQWLDGFGRRAIFVLGLYSFVFVVAALMRSSFNVRMFVFVFGCLRLGMTMVLYEAGYPENAKRMTRRGAMYGWLVLIGFLLVDLVFRSWMTVGSEVLKGLSSYLSANSVVAASAMVVLALVVFALVMIPLSGLVRVFHEGSLKPLIWVTSIVFVLVASAMTYSHLKTSKQDDVQSEKKQVQVEAQPAFYPASIPQQSTTSSSKRSSKPKGKSSICSQALSARAYEAAGCNK